MCNCTEEIEKKTAERLVAQGFILGDAPQLAVVLAMDSNSGMKVNTATEMTYSIVKSLKNGNTKTVKQKTKVLHSYCPFCGEKKD